MADLGSIGTGGKGGAVITAPIGQYIPQYARRKIVFAGGLTPAPLYGISKDTSDGNPTQPSMKITHRGEFRFEWVVSSGSRTISVDCRQILNMTPYPRMRVLANAALGVTEQSASAASGTGWKTIGPISVSPSADGVLVVVLENLLDRPDSVCNFDKLVTT